MPTLEPGSLAAVLAWQSFAAGIVAVLVLVARRLAGDRIEPRWRRALWLFVLVALAWPFPGPAVATAWKGARWLSETTGGPRGGSWFGDAAATGRTLRWIVPVWLGVAGLLLLRLAAGVVRDAVHSRASRPLSSWRAWKLLQESKERIGLVRSVRLFVSHRSHSPRLVGWLRPKLIVPRRLLETLSDDELRFVLLHELGHVRFHDVAWAIVASVVRALLWFNPLLHVAARRLRGDCEEACDALAIQHGSGSAGLLGATLAKIAGLGIDPGSETESRLGSAAFVPTLPRDLADRLRSATGPVIARRSTVWAIGSALAVLLLGFGLPT